MDGGFRRAKKKIEFDWNKKLLSKTKLRAYSKRDTTRNQRCREKPLKPLYGRNHGHSSVVSVEISLGKTG